MKRSEGKLDLLIGTALLSPALRLIPGSAAALGGSSAWLGPLAALPLGLLYAALLRRLRGTLNPGECFPELVRRALGRRPGGALLLLFAGWLLVYTAFLLRTGADRLQITAYPHSGPGFFMLSMGLLILIAALGPFRSLTRLARACNVIAPQTARTMGGGLAAGALNKPKRFFGAARNTREAGSLTIIATITGDTANELDQAILREFRGNSNMTCAFLRGKNGQPVMQAADCGTIHNEWLQTEEEIKLAERLRAEIAGMQPEEAMEKLLHDMAAHETNESWSAAEAGEAPKENE